MAKLRVGLIGLGEVAQLMHLPLLWEGAIESLSGVRAGAPVYRCLARLREAGLVGEICPSLRAGRNPGLLCRRP